MAKSQINTKSRDYLRDKEVFLKELKQFNESKNIPYKIPVVNGVDIDLYLLYSLVIQRGGLSKVNQNDTWESFLRQLRLPHPCVNGSTLLRRIYGTYLEKYERAKGPPGRDDDNDLDEDPRRGRGGGMPRISFGSGTYISASGEPLRTGNRVAGPSERLTLSLLSPMPNEQDFAVNVCTVLAADHSNRLPLSTTHHILDFLLAHAGVYNHSSLRDTIGRSYYEARGRYPHEFWQMRAGGGGAKELADETKFMQPGLEQPELMVQALAAHNTLTDCLMQDGEEEDSLEKIIEDDIHEDWVTEPSEEDQLFAPELTGGAGCVYTQRVLQIASIVRSLSFHEENVQYLARNTTLIRFLLLCANCWVGTLRQSGLDTLGNVSTELIIKDPATCLISRHVLSTIQSALVSQDRARVLAALELLNKLAQNEANEEALLKALESKVYSDVCALLSLRDIMVLVCTLECVYALTSLGDRACEAVARVPGLAHTLVALVTVEAQSYGPRACILMRVVETVSGPGALAAGDAERAHVAPQTPQNQPAKPSEPLQTSVSPAPAPAPPAPTPAPVPMSSLQQSHLQQRTVQENEHFAQAWLRATYEPLPGSDNSACDAAELYRQYLACCTKLSRKGVIAPAHFPRLVRTVFGGTVGPNTISNASGETQHVYIGIRAKNLPNRTNPPVGPSSPILKAQLTNKTAVVETKPPAVQTQTPAAPTHPQLSQALEGASNTSLIKHLLAHKVSPPAHAHAQVAQRQQSQQRVVPASTGTVVVQPNQTTNMEVDPEALIKCTTIIPGGVANNTGGQGEKMVLNAGEEVMVQKDEPVQIQIDDQLTIKSAQNKMLADLLEKKSNPPVQVVQMGQQMTAPTIQITETGQIVQVKAENNPLLQINSENTQPSAPFFQIKNEQGQLIQIKNDQGQIIQLKSDQLQGMIQFKNDQGQIVQIKNDGQSIAQMLQPSVIQAVKTDKDQIVETVVTDHSYTEPPTKKLKVEEKPEVQQPTMQVQQPTIQVQQSTIQVQQPMQVQQPTLQMQASTIQVQQPTLQVQQPMLQVQPMDVQNIIASQSGQLILQEKPVTSQTTQFMQQPMQIIATPGTSQAGLSYIAQNISGNMMQKTIIIVQGPTGGGPLTLTVNNPAGLDEATLNTLIAQATEAITQQQIIQNSGVIQSTQRVIVSQPALVSTSQPIAVVKTTITQNAPQITPSQQPIITTQPQPHKAQIVNQAQTQQIVVTQKQPPALISTSSGNPIVGTNQIIQGNQQLLQGNQQIIAVSSNQQIIMNTPMKQGVVQHRVVQQPQRSQITTVAISNNQTSTTMSESKTVPIQSGAKSQQPIIRQVITRQPIMMGNTKIGDKEVLVTQPVAEKQPVPKKTVTPPPQPLPPGAEDTPWICHWRGCGKSFGGAGAVFAHAARAHCPAGAGGEAPCQWLDCDRVPRRTFALLNHLTDKHCTPQALKAIYNSRRHTIAESEASKPVSLGYPPNAALAALNKHSTDMFNPRELMDENEGPVTKSIRLTAALILRNIVIYSNTGRRLLRSYEAHLASIALSNVEASRTIAQVLYDMNNI
ncbi:AT-rich interactive domain-containing protein 2 isoform X9 [Nymphalis io]|uniref:AT-rich interactive domain-containing protein 2 isoform X9 n=1 Tax=Inachis io TaxID=171585 RepID=UPI002168BB88|nr:AT-rich interactive domain-containing protein 2 isoform X9 [Nymphalis io]